MISEDPAQLWRERGRRAAVIPVSPLSRIGSPGERPRSRAPGPPAIRPSLTFIWRWHLVLAGLAQFENPELAAYLLFLADYLLMRRSLEEELGGGACARRPQDDDHDPCRGSITSLVSAAERLLPIGPRGENPLPRGLEP